jgi:hypothetical protein
MDAKTLLIYAACLLGPWALFPLYVCLCFVCDLLFRKDKEE